MLLGSCSDDKDKSLVEDADVAHVQTAGTTYNSLSFSWDKMPGVNQYGYELTDAAGAVIDEGVTTATKVSFSDLVSDSPYTFELRVYGGNGATSYRHITEVKTLPIVQLASPQVSAAQYGNKVKLTWKPVENAAAYEYSYLLGEEVVTATVSGSAEGDLSCLIAGLAPGAHQISLRALSDYGGYTDSEPSVVNAVRSRTEIGTVTGTYTCGLIRRNNS